MRNTAVTIPFTKLAEYVRMGEDLARDMPRDAERRFPSNIKKRKRTSTPPERLKSPDEERFQTDEDVWERRMSREDASWTGEGSGGGKRRGSGRLAPSIEAEAFRGALTTQSRNF